MSNTEVNEPIAQALVDYTRSLDCIHCGLCLHTCPTYQLTGAEPSSPRGRIHLMRAVAEGRLAADQSFADEMDFCLVCRHCESVCPAGVEFGAMMEITRNGLMRSVPRGPLVRFARWLGFRVVLPSRGWLRFATSSLGLAQRLGLVRLIAPLFGERGRALGAFPRVPAGSERKPLAALTPAAGEKRGAAAMLAGCVMPEMLGRVNRATADCLSACGLDVHAPEGHVCCGALHAHNGDLDGARDLARQTIAAFEPLDGDVVVNSAGCGAHMKVYGELLAEDDAWKERALAFEQRVVDFAEFLAQPANSKRLAAAVGDSTESVVYDDPCHLCHGQGVRSQPRELLDLLPGAERAELEDSESCCGSAGIYSMLRPKDSNAILAPKLNALRASGAKTLVTANPGCQIQWESGVRRESMDVEVAHLAEVLQRALK